MLLESTSTWATDIKSHILFLLMSLLRSMGDMWIRTSFCLQLNSEYNKETSILLRLFPCKYPLNKTCSFSATYYIEPTMRDTISAIIYQANIFQSRYFLLNLITGLLRRVQRGKNQRLVSFKRRSFNIVLLFC